MPMSYSWYVERHKELDALCVSAESQYLEATGRWNQASSDKRTAQRDFDRANEETKPERASELHASTDRLESATRDMSECSEKRERTWADRAAFEKNNPVYDAALKQDVQPGDKDEPPVTPSEHEKTGNYMEQAIGGLKATVQGVGMASQIFMATHTSDHVQVQTPIPMEQMQQRIEALSQSVPLDQYESQVYEYRETKQPSAFLDTEVEKKTGKAELDEQAEALAESEKKTTVEDLKKENDRIVGEAAKPTMNSSVLEPEKAAEVIAEQKRTVANDNNPEQGPPERRELPDPEHPNPSAARGVPANDNEPAQVPANDNRRQPPSIPDPDRPVPMPARTGSGAGIPDPDRPSPALAAAQTAPANDNKPRSPANDNDPNF